MSTDIFLKMLLLLSALFIVCLFASCADDTRLQSGTWSGVVIPQNHPEIETPITYEVGYVKDQLEMILHTPEGLPINLTNISREQDVLKFHFLEPDANVPLSCLLKGNVEEGFVGKCTDADGKWASFTLVPPE